MPVDACEAAHQCGAVHLLELIEFARVNDASDHLAHLERLARIGRDDGSEFGRIEGGGLRFLEIVSSTRLSGQRSEDGTRSLDRIFIVLSEVIGDATRSAMQFSAAQFLGTDLLACGGLHQWWTAEEDGALIADDDRLVTHRGNIGAAGGARSHDDGDLRNALCAHPGLVVEDPAEVITVGKDLVLQRQVGPARIDQVDAGKPVLLGDLLRPEVFLDRQWVITAALDGGIVGDDHRQSVLDAADPTDDPGTG